MENHALDVVTCGELLIDFVAMEAGTTLAQASLFKKSAGARLRMWRWALHDWVIASVFWDRWVTMSLVIFWLKHFSTMG